MAYMSSVNLARSHELAVMEIFEAIAWVAIGFAPTLAAMEAAWKISRRKLAPIEVGIRR